MSRPYFLSERLFGNPRSVVSHGYSVTTWVTNVARGWDRPDFIPEHTLNPTTFDFETQYSNWASNAPGNVTFMIPQNARVSFSWRTTNTGEFYETPYSRLFGNDGFDESAEKFLGYLEELLLRYEVDIWDAQLNVRVAVDIGGSEENILHGAMQTKRFDSIFENYVIFDHDSKKLCVWKAIWKGHYIHKHQNQEACIITSKALANKVSQFRKQVIDAGYIDAEEERTPRIIRACLNYLQEKLKMTYRIHLMDFSFKLFEEFIPRHTAVRYREIIVRDTGKGHAQLVMDKSFISEFADMSALKTENALHKTKFGDTNTFVYWINGENRFYYKGKQYNKASLNAELYRTGFIVTEQTQIKPREDVKLTTMRKFASFDLETVPDEDGNQIAFLSGLYFCEKNKIEVCVTEDIDCMSEMLDWMRENSEEMDGRTVYAHNGGKFDYFILLKQILEDGRGWEIVPDSLFVICGGISAFTIKYKKVKVHFKDSCRLIASSLAGAANSFGTRTKKLADFDIVEAAKERHDPKVMEEIKKYHYNDIECLYQVMEIFQDRFFKASDFEQNGRGMDVVEFITISQAAINIFLQKCLRFTPEVYTPPPILDRLFRNYFYGGRCEIFAQGLVKGQIEFIDVNSLYPDQMRRPLPYGKHCFYTREQGSSFFSKVLNTDFEEDSLNQNFFGFVHCKVWQTDYEKWKKFPQYIPYHNGTILHFPFFDKKFELILFSEEIKLLQELNLCGYHFEFINFIESKPDNYLKKHVTKLHDVKMEASKNQDPAMRNTSKLIMNSTFGYFGINTDRECIKILGKKERYFVSEAFQEGKMLDFNKCSDSVVVKVSEIIPIRCSKVEVSSAITSYSRMKQWQVQTELVSQGHELLFGDTDSVGFKVNGTMRGFVNSSFYRQRIVGGQAEVLGQEKDEFFQMARKAFKGKENLMKEYLEKFELTLEDELMPIEQCAIVAAKGYFCVSDYKGVRVQKYALKGGNFIRHNETVEKTGEGQKVDFEQFVERLIDNDELELFQTVFKSGAPSFFDPEHPLRVRVEETKKKFRKIYQKGKPVPKGGYYIMEPYTISEIEENDGVLQKYPIQKVLDCFLNK